MVLRRFYTNITNCVGRTIYWSKTFFITSFKKKIASLKCFEKYFGSNILASSAKFQCQGTNIFGWV